MRIGINLLAFLPGVSGGIEFYVRNLILALARMDAINEYYLFANRDNHDVYSVDQCNFHQVQIDVGARPQLNRILWEQLRFPLLLCQFRLDVFHSPSYTFPVFATVPGVLTICDMLYKVYPESMDKTKLAFWRVFVPLSAKRCRRVLTISESSRRDIVDSLHVSPEKVISTPLALDRQLAEMHQPTVNAVLQVCQKYGIRPPYILYVGGVGKHKNPISSVRALAELQKRPPMASLSLVITGNDYGSKAEIEAEAMRLGIEESICLPGYVTRSDLPALYKGCVAYLSTSHFEGFGLTILEAMAFGAPVVTSNRSSLPEVAGDAALIVNPDNIREIADAIAVFMLDSDQRNEMIARGYRRVRDFSWERLAQQTLEVYREAAGLAIGY